MTDQDYDNPGFIASCKAKAKAETVYLRDAIKDLRTVKSRTTDPEQGWVFHEIELARNELASIMTHLTTVWEPKPNDTIVFKAGASIQETPRAEPKIVFQDETEMRVFTYIGNHSLCLEYADCKHNSYGFPDRSIQVFLADLQALYFKGDITHQPQETQ